MPPPEQLVQLAGAALAAGVMNALAGGGTILTFPALVFAGLDTIHANATSTVALVPGAMASMVVHRREVAEHRAWAFALLLPSILGGAIGSALLLVTPEKLFAGLAPWLVLFATLLFLLQILATRRGVVFGRGIAPERRRGIAWAYQLGVAVYGGYFGAGIGILMLVALGFLGLTDFHAMNGLKNFLGACINGVATVCFVVAGLVDWRFAPVMALGSLLGGYIGARLTRFVGRERARWGVVIVGLFVTGWMLWR